MNQVRDHCLASARACGASLAGDCYMRLFPEPPTLAIEPGPLVPAIGGPGLADLLASCCTSNPRLTGLQDDRTGPPGPPRRGVS